MPSEKPLFNEDIFNLRVRINHLVQKVRAFVSMTRLIASLQRYVAERIEPGKGGFVADFKVSFNPQLFLYYSCGRRLIFGHIP